jgi:hypothetical protein
MNQLNVSYIDAPNEADTLCVFMVKNHIAWACLSDDMDMFVYGCNRVIRNLDINTQTSLLYDLNQILYELRCSMKEFREIMVLSGTDYNTNNTHTLTHTLRLFNIYKKAKTKECFYNWLKNNTDYIDNYENLMKTHRLFIVDNYENLCMYKNYNEHLKSEDGFTSSIKVC